MNKTFLFPHLLIHFQLPLEQLLLLLQQQLVPRLLVGSEGTLRRALLSAGRTLKTCTQIVSFYFRVCYNHGSTLYS